jgi:hypothetical protein
MATERQIQETIARCVSAMAYYHDSERSPKSDEHMIAEVQVIAGFVKELGFSESGVAWRIIRTVESDLIDRYGYEVGPRLSAQFIGAFESLDIPRDRRQSRNIASWVR